MVDLPLLSTHVRQVVGKLIAECSIEQRRQMCRDIDSDVLQRWTYLPGSRPGLSLGDMDRSQRLLVHKLLGAVLSEAAHTQVATIMATEDVLDRREGSHGRRHSTDFWFLAFGDPDSGSVCAWRLEGHHMCVHVTIVDNDITIAPIFLGSNPAVIMSQGQMLSAPLGIEEQLARTVMATLDSSARAEVVVAPKAPDDIYTSTQVTPDHAMLADLQPGMAVAHMDAAGRRAADELLDLYAGRLEGALAFDLRDRLRAEHFSIAWEGSLEPGQAHYYRLLSAAYVIEHENAANNANHIHNVMRMRSGDLDGADLLAAHKRHLHPPG